MLSIEKKGKYNEREQINKKDINRSIGVFQDFLFCLTDEPQRGDIVSFHYPDHEEELFLKRVMGIPGETIEGISGYIYINGVKLDEDYTSEIIDYDFGPFIIPEDCYFMMGDNRNNSWDSRYWQNHFVEKSKIIGKAEIEYYPQIKILK